MSELLDKLLREERAKGYAEGYAEQTVCGIRNVMEKLNVTAEKAMDFLDIPEAEREMYRKLLAQ